MKRPYISSAVGVTLLVVGFVGGQIFQHAKTGFHSKILAEKEYGSPKDPVRWRLVSETIGMPFLDPETSILEYRGRTIYKARREFQEKVPVAANIRITNNRIDWDDGELQFHLIIEEIKKSESVNATIPSQGDRQETNQTPSEIYSRH